MIGHAGSTYYQKSEKERMELFGKLEHYLTYLDVASLEAKGADVEARTEQVMAENLTLKQQVENLYKILYAQGIIKQGPPSWLVIYNRTIMRGEPFSCNFLLIVALTNVYRDIPILPRLVNLSSIRVTNLDPQFR